MDEADLAQPENSFDFWWDFGLRRGIFDKCNGRERRDCSTWNEFAADGYAEGWNSNEVKIHA